jgi:hypothetical protein
MDTPVRHDHPVKDRVAILGWESGGGGGGGAVWDGIWKLPLHPQFLQYRASATGRPDIGIIMGSRNEITSSGSWDVGSCSTMTTGDATRTPLAREGWVGRSHQESVETISVRIARRTAKIRPSTALSAPAASPRPSMLATLEVEERRVEWDGTPSPDAG